VWSWEKKKDAARVFFSSAKIVATDFAIVDLPDPATPLSMTRRIESGVLVKHATRSLIMLTRVPSMHFSGVLAAL
jgi:hypothetical protein